MPDVYLMHKPVAVLAACVLLLGCGGSTPTDPTKIPALAPTRFLAFGDSLTSGEVSVPVGVISDRPATGILTPPSTRQILVPAASYPTQLLALLRSRYLVQAATIAVTNAGKPAEHPHEGLQRFADALAETRPEVVLLLEGANSLWLYGSDLPTLALGQMVDRAHGSGARVLVATLPPSRPGRIQSVPMVELLAFNRKLTEMAAIKGTGLVNLYDPMLSEAETLIGGDGLHPTEAGYKRIAELFFASIQAHLEVK